MGLVELFIIAVGLSMDAFAVAICKGLSVKQLKLKHNIIVGLYFGGFQGLMPLVGYLLGVRFQEAITSIDHWIAFVLLGLIGFNMIREALSKEEEQVSDAFDVKTMVPLAVATSIDALAVGVSFAFLKVDIWMAVLLIGVTTAAFSGAGVLIGNAFGCRYKSKAELAGGLILMVMGVRILVTHLWC